MLSGYFKHVLLAGVGLCAVWAPASAALAQNDDTPAELEEVIVTARKTVESAQDVPQTVSVLSDATLQKVGIRRIDDLPIKVTGLNLAKTQTNTINAVIRGVGSFRNVNGVGFFFDDIQEFSAFSQSTFDVARVEVLKGPQATLYGGLNIGGAVKYVFKEPQFDPAGEIEAALGTHGIRTIYGGYTGPISDMVAVRISGYYDHAGGMLENAFNGETIGGRRDYGGRLAVKATLGDLTVEAALRGNDFRTTRQQTQTNSPTPAKSDVNFVVYAQDPVFGSFKTIAPTLRLDYEMGKTTFTSLSGYSHTKGEFLADSVAAAPPPGSNVPYLPLIRIHRREPEKVWQQEFRVQTQLSDALSLLVGASYLNRTHDMHGVTNILSAPPAFAIMQTINNENRYRIKQYGAFATLKYEVSSRLEVSLGGRINRSINTFTDYLAGQAIIQDGNRVVIPVGTPIRASESDFIPRVDVSYHLDEDTMLYASYARGVTPAGAAVATSSAAQPFGRESTDAFEAGVKADLMDRKLRLNVAAFLTNYSQRTFTTAFLPANSASVRINQNIGDSRNLGFEAEMIARLTPELTASAGLSYVDAEWKSGTRINLIDSSLPPAQRVPTPFDISGLQVPTTPEWTGNASIDWSHPVSQDVTLLARIDGSYFGKQYWDLRNTYSASDYVLIGAQIGVEYRQWTLLAQVRNLTDSRYNLDWIPLRDSGAAVNLGFPGDRRTFRATLIGKF